MVAKCSCRTITDEALARLRGETNHKGAEMTNDPQVPWTDEQWARVNQVIQEEASRARVAATFLPLIGPLPGDTDFVRRELISYPAMPAALSLLQTRWPSTTGISATCDAASAGARAWRADGRSRDDQRAGDIPSRRQRRRSPRGRRGVQGIGARTGASTVPREESPALGRSGKSRAVKYSAGSWTLPTHPS